MFERIVKAMELIFLSFFLCFRSLSIFFLYSFSTIISIRNPNCVCVCWICIDFSLKWIVKAAAAPVHFDDENRFVTFFGCWFLLTCLLMLEFDRLMYLVLSLSQRSPVTKQFDYFFHLTFSTRVMPWTEKCFSFLFFFSTCNNSKQNTNNFIASSPSHWGLNAKQSSFVNPHVNNFQWAKCKKEILILPFDFDKSFKFIHEWKQLHQRN